MCASMVETTGNAMFGGVPVERGYLRNDRFRSGNIKRTGRVQEIQLRVDVKKNVKESPLHTAAAPLLTVSFSAASSGLMSTRQAASLANRLRQVAGSRLSDSEA